MAEKTGQINHEMTVLEIVSKYGETEAVFKRYDKKAGECICCQALFDTLSDIAQRYGLDLNELISELENVGLGKDSGHID